MSLPRTPSPHLDGRRALVAGASSGIGLGCAVALAEAGAHVVMAARSVDRLDEALQAFKTDGLSAEALPLDIADVDATQRVVAALGPFDVLVNSAGLARHSPATETTPDDFDAVFGINVRGAYFLTRAVAKGLLAAGRPGSLINISSQMAHVGGQDRAVYSSTKHAVEGFTKSMAIEWGAAGIRVNTICPTFIRTPLTEETFANPERAQWISQKIKLGRVGRVEDIMGAVAYLASDQAAMVTGTALMVDGGLDGRLMKNEKVTSLDVAKMAGVSQSAVSRYFTPGTSVSKKTSEKVKKAADALGYRPNIIARSLITGQSRIIGLVVAYLENYFYPEVVERLSKALQDQGYHVLVFISSIGSENVDKITQEILDYQVDGIVLASANMSEELAARCHSSGVPIVLFNRLQDDARLSAVTSDNRAGGDKLAEHLVALGHRNLGYIAGFEGASTQRDRERGFREGLERAGLRLNAREVGNFRYEEAQVAARRMFAGAERPDAVFVCNDHMAFAVMDVLRFELGLRIPEDVSVVGFDDVPPAKWPAYNLTTIRQNVDDMVAATVAMLLGSIGEAGTAPRRIVLDGELIVRGSTAPPGAGKPNPRIRPI